MIRNLFNAIINADIGSLISILLSAGLLLFVCLPIHELAHAWAANKLGDSTAKYQGRLTLNPLKHLDIFGSLMILFVGIGYAKPVPVNMLNFKNRKRDMALTAAAGPLSNFLMAAIFTFLLVLFENLHTGPDNTLITILHSAVSIAAAINIGLAVFNLIPIPPFDGGRIVGYFLPDRIYYKIMEYEHIILMVVMVLIFLGALSGPLQNIMLSVFAALYRFFSIPFLLLRGV